MSHLRATLRLTGIILTLLLALVLHGLWRLVRARSPWPRWLLGRVGWWCGADARVVGRPLRRDVVFVSNHLSWLDILLIAGATGTTFVAKAELKSVPVVGWLCELNHTLFVERGDRMGVEAQIERIRQQLREGWAVTLFPEGTTGDGHTLLPFKAALFAALDPPPDGVRVQPIRLDYGDATDEFAWVGDEPGLSHARRVLGRPGRFTATLRFGELFAPTGGRKAIAADVRARMEELGTVGSDVDLQARRPVWSALADLFLDTDVSLLRDADAQILAGSPFTIDQIEQILINEVTPVCSGNLLSVAGEWAGFDPDWLESKIVARLDNGLPTGRRMKMMWPDWLALREAVVQLRGLGVELAAPHRTQ